MKIRFTVTLTDATLRALRVEGLNTGQEICAHFKEVLAAELQTIKDEAYASGDEDDDPEGEEDPDDL